LIKIGGSLAHWNNLTIHLATVQGKNKGVSLKLPSVLSRVTLWLISSSAWGSSSSLALFVIVSVYDKCQAVFFKLHYFLAFPRTFGIGPF
jgi:hypothetical protein